ncbi:hypothetical protein EJD97_014581 [Solanum chilense]|uniref:Uncharacterized protein n=1 Tax=Solanum chilense TaxID=4083 RepID=A0A6N2B8J2_SOLCI|nr:hypothetical protein EJD97_014581 [Solanum chilense]
MMADTLKASSRSTAENRSTRTFILSNFKLPESGVIYVSAEETEKGYRKETAKGKRKRSQGSVLDASFQPKVPILHEEEVRKFYYNIQFQEDGSVNTRVNDISVHLDETLLGKILRVPRDGLFKKVMKSEYLLVFKFVNKTLLPRTKKRISATSVDLFVMELLCKFEPLNLLRLMVEHMYKTVIERKGIHGMGYGYFLTKIFKYFNIPLGVGMVGTVKQDFSETTFVEYECNKGKGNPKSKMAQLIEDQDQLKHEVEELTMRLSGKDAEIAILKAELLTVQTEGPGTDAVQALKRENAELRAKVIALQEKAIKDNDATNARLTLIIQSLSHQPPPS